MHRFHRPGLPEHQFDVALLQRGLHQRGSMSAAGIPMPPRTVSSNGTLGSASRNNPIVRRGKEALCRCYPTALVADRPPGCSRGRPPDRGGTVELPCRCGEGFGGGAACVRYRSDHWGAGCGIPPGGAGRQHGIRGAAAGRRA